MSLDLRKKHVVMYPDQPGASGAGGGSGGSTPPAGTPPAGNETPAGETPPAGEAPPAGETPPAGEQPPAGSGEQPQTPAGDTEQARRYSELTARVKAAERAAAEASERERLALEAVTRLGRPAPEKKPDEPVEPTAPEWNGDPVQYQQDMVKYARDLSTFAAGKAANAAVAEADARRGKETQAETTQKMQQAWTKRRADAITRLPDYEVVAENPNLKITEVMAGAIMTDEKGPDVAHWLGQNLAEAERIAGLSPMQQLVEFGALKAKVAAVRQKSTISQTPPPSGKPQGGGSSQPVNPADLPMEDYAARRNEQLAKDRRPGNR